MASGHCSWADLREDQMIYPAPVFWPTFGPLGPRRAPEALRRALEIVQVAPKSDLGTDSKTRSWVLCAFGAGRKENKR